MLKTEIRTGRCTKSRNKAQDQSSKDKALVIIVTITITTQRWGVVGTVFAIAGLNAWEAGHLARTFPWNVTSFVLAIEVCDIAKFNRRTVLSVHSALQLIVWSLLPTMVCRVV